MKTIYKAKLEEKIQKWLDENCEDIVEDEPSGYFYPDLVKDMASAAEIVFDASMQGQSFAEEEKAP